MSGQDWLTVRRGQSPLLVSLPHTGTDLGEVEARLVSRWLGQRDCDWWIDRLYDFVAELDATVVHTALSRTVIDVNRDPSGASLYPGQATTGLCPTETFDGDPLYRPGQEPDPAEIDRRRARLLRALPCGVDERVGTAEIAPRQGRPLRLPLDPLGGPAAVSGNAARLQSRHQ